MWLFKPAKKELDIERTYLRVQFLTTEQKTFKQSAVKKLQKQYQDDEESIVPYETAFPVSHRFILNTADISGTGEPIKEKMLIKQLLCHLEVTKDQRLEEFTKTYLKEVQIFIMNEEMLSRNEVVPLFSQIEATIYTPSEVLEVIFEQRSLWERIKIKTRKVFKDIPKAFFGLLRRILGFFFGMVGLDGTAKAVIMKIVPTKSIIQYLLTTIAMFFPMLGPLISMGSHIFLK